MWLLNNISALCHCFNVTHIHYATIITLQRSRQEMLTDVELDRLFERWKTPQAGRTLVRKIRETGPVQSLQYQTDTIRTRYISKKMGRALLAVSRTCDFPAIYLRDNDNATLELWPQPHAFDLATRGLKGGTSRLQHTPTLFLIEEGEGFVFEEWRDRARLQQSAERNPEQFYCDQEGCWHFRSMEDHLKPLAITYRLRCTDEHPRVLLSNLEFLADYSRESTPPVPDEERDRMAAVMAELHKVPHLSLVHEHQFKADHIFQLVMEGEVFVDVRERLLRNVDELVIYRTKAIAQADALLHHGQTTALPSNAFRITVGTRFLYDGRRYQVALLGNTQVQARDLDSGALTYLEVTTLEQLHEQNMVVADGKQFADKQLDGHALFNEKRLAEALERLEWLANPDLAPVSERTIRRLRKRIAGITTPQDQIDALMNRRQGNFLTKLPSDAIRLAKETVKDFHNRPNNPKVMATYNKYVERCTTSGVKAMSRAQFYRWIKTQEDIEKREGRRAAYQKSAIPLTPDFHHPVHGVLPHEVCYCDHTILNVFLKGTLLDNLGKPTITLMVDGALSKPRAFYLSYQPACANSVLMCLRDYVRRNGRLPRMLVLDNGREFHSEALLHFCSIFGIHIRWRRAAKPRDSAIIERMLGVTEQEVIAQLDGNSLALKDPRNVSPTHNPDKHIRWTLPALYGAIEHYLFTIHPNRIHPRFGMSPNAYESRLKLECGAREHLPVRYDALFKLLTAPHSGRATRVIDRIRGVFVDGHWYWHDKLAMATKNEVAIVRVEPWRARVIYVCFRNGWYTAVARDGGALEGRHRPEFELQKREESRARRNAAQKDKASPKNSQLRTQLWAPENWDPRLREQLCEMYVLYELLGMTEVLPDARNAQGALPHLPMTKGSELDLVYAIQKEAQLELATKDEQPSSSEPANESASQSIRNAEKSTPQAERVSAADRPVPAEWEIVEADDYF